jgi:hypothetical protein
LPNITDYIIRDKITGIITEGNDPICFANGIEEIWNNKERWLDMSLKARTWIMHNFSCAKEKRNFQLAIQNSIITKIDGKKTSLQSFINLFYLVGLREFLPSRFRIWIRKKR